MSVVAHCFTGLSEVVYVSFYLSVYKCCLRIYYLLRSDKKFSLFNFELLKYLCYILQTKLFNLILIGLQGKCVLLLSYTRPTGLQMQQ